MKQVDKSNRLWYETANGETKIGLTKEFLNSLEDCFHILPGKRRSFVRKDGPLISVETGECLFSIPSPVRGVVTFFDDKAMNFPEKLTEEDVICVLAEKPSETPQNPLVQWVVATGMRGQANNPIIEVEE